MDFEEMGLGDKDLEKNKKRTVSHYYGDVVRRLFLIGSLMMAVSLPFISSLVPGSIHFSLFIIVLLGLVAGLLSPKQRWVIAVNLLISLIAVVVFEYHAVSLYSESGVQSFFFWLNQILAINFLLGLYYSSKTFRGIILNGED